MACGSGVDDGGGVYRRGGGDYMGVTILLVMVKLLAVYTGVTDPLDQER
jgi:hypothetical protein